MSDLLAPEPICVCDSTWLHPTDAEDVEFST